MVLAERFQVICSCALSGFCTQWDWVPVVGLLDCRLWIESSHLRDYLHITNQINGGHSNRLDSPSSCKTWPFVACTFATLQLQADQLLRIRQCDIGSFAGLHQIWSSLSSSKTAVKVY